MGRAEAGWWSKGPVGPSASTPARGALTPLSPVTDRAASRAWRKISAADALRPTSCKEAAGTADRHRDLTKRGQDEDPSASFTPAPSHESISSASPR
jgi:hypothetical protein